jgi:hypothetical protein
MANLSGFSEAMTDAATVITKSHVTECRWSQLLGNFNAERFVSWLSSLLIVTSHPMLADYARAAE